MNSSSKCSGKVQYHTVRQRQKTIKEGSQPGHGIEKGRLDQCIR